MDRLGGLVVIAPLCRAGDPGSNPGPGETFFSKVNNLDEELRILTHFMSPMRLMSIRIKYLPFLVNVSVVLR